MRNSGKKEVTTVGSAVRKFSLSQPVSEGLDALQFTINNLNHQITHIFQKYFRYRV
jgi:hypothetical protein